MKSHLLEIDKSIRHGDRDLAATLLAKISTKNLTNREREEYCGLALRLGKADTVLRLLGGELIRSYQTRQEFPSVLKACYAQALTQVGAVQQASRIFQELLKEGTAVPRLHLYAAVNLFAQWKYEDAAGLLKIGLAQVTNDYECLVLKLNLISALLVIDQKSEARSLIEELQNLLNPAQHKLLYWNLQELCAQEHLYSGRFEEARELLEKLANDPSLPSDRYKLFIEKWSLMRRILVRDPAIQIKAINDFRNRAQELEHWESFRESFLLEALLTGQLEHLTQVELGTPWTPYRTRAQSLFSSLHGKLQASRPENWLQWDKKQNGFSSPVVVDTRSGTSSDGKLQLKPGSLPHRLLLTLTQDLFRPASVGNLFSELWPDEFYDPVHSPDRIYQLIARLRKALRATPGVEVIEHNGHYRIRTHNEYAIQVWRDRFDDLEVQAFVDTLQRLPIAPTFQSGELVTYLQKSQATVVSLLNRSVAQKRLEKLGAGARTRYKLVA